MVSRVITWSTPITERSRRAGARRSRSTAPRASGPPTPRSGPGERGGEPAHDPASGIPLPGGGASGAAAARVEVAQGHHVEAGALDQAAHRAGRQREEMEDRVGIPAAPADQRAEVGEQRCPRRVEGGVGNPHDQEPAGPEHARGFLRHAQRMDRVVQHVHQRERIEGGAGKRQRARVGLHHRPGGRRRWRTPGAPGSVPVVRQPPASAASMR